MTKVKVLVGIDISKNTFDVCVLTAGKGTSNVYSNDPQGFKEFIITLPAESHCVMEATGPYYLPLASWLSSQGIAVSVMNPLVIKNFCQMGLRRAKTDKADARQLAEYGHIHPLEIWTPPQPYVLYLKQYWAYEQQLTGHKIALGNLLESMAATGNNCRPLQKQINRDIKRLEKQLAGIWQAMDTIATAHYGPALESITTIPGIGRKTGMLMLLLTDGFRRFENAKQVVAYFGLSPRLYQSGTSVRGKGRICKMGMSRIRSYLYVCAWSAKKHNIFCKELYDRLVAKGKAKMVALIAVATKLVRQAFAITKSQVCFQKNYSRNICF